MPSLFQPIRVLGPEGGARILVHVLPGVDAFGVVQTQAVQLRWGQCLQVVVERLTQHAPGALHLARLAETQMGEGGAPVPTPGHELILRGQIDLGRVARSPAHGRMMSWPSGFLGRADGA